VVVTVRLCLVVVLDCVVGNSKITAKLEPCCCWVVALLCIFIFVFFCNNSFAFVCCYREVLEMRNTSLWKVCLPLNCNFLLLLQLLLLVVGQLLLS